MFLVLLILGLVFSKEFYTWYDGGDFEEGETETLDHFTGVSAMYYMFSYYEDVGEVYITHNGVTVKSWRADILTHEDNTAFSAYYDGLDPEKKYEFLAHNPENITQPICIFDLGTGVFLYANPGEQKTIEKDWSGKIWSEPGHAKCYELPFPPFVSNVKMSVQANDTINIYFNEQNQTDFRAESSYDKNIKSGDISVDNFKNGHKFRYWMSICPVDFVYFAAEIKFSMKITVDLPV